jgi:uncharacterized membrane protein YvbJ
MNDGCPKCREYAMSGSSFCGACGRNLRYGGASNATKENKSESSKRGLSSVILQIVCVVVIAVAVFEVITLVI